MSFERNLKLLKEEELKPKPRVDVLKDLMSRTFPNRFDSLVNAVDPVSATQHISAYPLLKKSAYVSVYNILVCKVFILVHLE